ncbi:MAG: BLUF domain-containing protein [Janthinobacterium lividum]
MIQLVYISTPRGPVDLAAILRSSRRNNARCDVTGLLYHDGRRFLQALEGEERAVEETFERIRDDPRHCAMVILSRRIVDVREFGPWQMAERGPGADGEQVMRRIEPLLAAASPNVRATFEGFMQVARAA